MRGWWAIRLGAVAAAVVCLGGEPAEAAVSVRDGRVTGEFVDLPRIEALEVLARDGGLKVVGSLDDDPSTITAMFKDVPLERALGRVLEEKSFFFVYDSDGLLRRVHLLGSKHGELVPDDDESDGDADDLVQFREVMDVEIGLPPAGLLANRLGESQATLHELANLAMRDEDRRVRAEALDAAMRVVEENPRVQYAVDAYLQNASADQLAAQLYSAAGPWAVDLVRQALRHSQHSEVRTRLASIVRLLRRRD